MAKTPYRFWSRNDLFWKLKQQAGEYYCNDDIMEFTLKNACYDTRWNPAKDYNGCNIIQDDLHPFLPCFLHDWRWITRQNAKEADLEFKNNLVKFGYKRWKANLYFWAVRIGYLFYYQFKHIK
jgi:hypothetical protein